MTSVEDISAVVGNLQAVQEALEKEPEHDKNTTLLLRLLIEFMQMKELKAGGSEISMPSPKRQRVAEASCHGDSTGC